MQILKGEYEDFASRVDLDALARTVEGKNQVEKLFWTATFAAALVLSIFYTVQFASGYLTADITFVTSYDIVDMRLEGSVAFPDILICTSAPWDMDKINR